MRHPSRPYAHRLIAALTGLLLTATVTVTAAPAASAATPPDGIVFGAVGDTATLDAAAGSPIAVHTYGNFQGNVPTGEMITVNANGLPWRDVATAAPGSSLYTAIVRWADAIKGRDGDILLAFGHEPELSSKKALGTSAEYKQAFRHVVDVFRSRGVDNVQWVLQMSDWAFRTSATDPGHASAWYPGDAYVDIVGADAYNWHTCGEGLGRDVPLSTVAGGVVTFARAHGKLAALPEFAASATVDRARWLNEGYQWMTQNEDVLVAAFYFQHRPTNQANTDCVWMLNKTTELSAFGTVARALDASTTPPTTPTPTPTTPTPTPTTPAEGGSGLTVGAVGDSSALDGAAGRVLPQHAYANLQSSVPAGSLITVLTQDVAWRDISAAAPGSALYADIVRWADALKARDGVVTVAFGQEPELSSRRALGAAEEYKAAYRKVVDVFRAEGVSNVRWAVQFSAWSYRTATTDSSHVSKWYPGDAYVDVLGASALNWSSCDANTGAEATLSTLASGVVSFARAHGKSASLVEFATAAGDRRAAWLQSAHSWIDANSDIIESAYYFNRSPQAAKQTCSWPLTGTADLKAFAALAARA